MQSMLWLDLPLATAALAVALALRPWRALAGSAPPWPAMAWWALMPLLWSADRLSAITQWDWPQREAMVREWQGGRECLGDALAGAARFAAGQGRHGEF